MNALSRLESLLKDNPPFRSVHELSPDDVVELADVEDFTFIKSKKTREAVGRAITKRYKQISAAREKWSNFYAWVDSRVTKQGAWVHKLAHDGKLDFGDGYCTKSRVEAAARSNPNLTFREMPYGDGPSDTALAIFRGKPVETVTHEDQPLL